MERRSLIGLGGTAIAGIALAMALTFVWKSEQFAAPMTPSAAPAPALTPASIVETSYRSGIFGPVALYAPPAPPRGVVLFLSGDSGWDATSAGLARELAAQGMAVAGVSAPAYLARLEASRAACLNPSFDLMALSQDVQHHLGLAAYSRPVLAGRETGATLAYAALTQSPPGLWQGVVSLGFDGALPGRKPWCHVGILSAAATTPTATGWHFSSLTGLSAPWRTVRDPQWGASAANAVDRFVNRVISPGAEAPPQWPAAVTSLFDAADGPRAAGVPTDLPLTEITNPAAPTTDRFAILLSGDGGWAGLDRDLAANLAARGIPVVGFDSLRYFWAERTPTGAAQDLGRVIEDYSAAWKRPKVILIGYSFGADVLPAIVGQLPPAARAQVQGVALMGPGATANFQFHLADWIGGTGGGRPVAPDIAALAPTPVVCLQGNDDSGSICTRLPAGSARVALLPGGHHFNGNAGAVSSAILGTGLSTGEN